VFEFRRILCLSKVRADKDISGAVEASVCFWAKVLFVCRSFL
jgi:hypothetical protein